MSQAEPDFHIILKALEENHALYVLIGGLAMNFHGSAHVTVDVDVCVSREKSNLQKVAEALKAFNPRLRGVPAELPFIWDAHTLSSASVLTLETQVADVDILMEPSGAPPFFQLYEASEPYDWDGVSVRVASIEDLISMKKAANRAKDQAHIMELEAIRKMNGTDGS